MFGSIGSGYCRSVRLRCCARAARIPPAAPTFCVSSRLVAHWFFLWPHGSTLFCAHIYRWFISRENFPMPVRFSYLPYVHNLSTCFLPILTTHPSITILRSLFCAAHTYTRHLTLRSAHLPLRTGLPPPHFTLLRGAAVLRSSSYDLVLSARFTRTLRTPYLRVLPTVRILVTLHATFTFCFIHTRTPYYHTTCSRTGVTDYYYISTTTFYPSSSFTHRLFLLF